MKISPSLLALALVGILGTGSARAEDLMDMLRLAVANDPTLAEADASKRATNEGVPISRAALLPQASATQALTDTRGGDLDTQLGHSRQRDLSGTISQTLFNAADIASYREAKATAEAGEQTLQAARLDLYERVVETYFQVLVAQDNLKTYDAYEDAYRREYEQTRVRYEQQLSAEVDMNQAQAYYLSIKSQRISVINTLENARQALMKIIGRYPGTLATLREDFPMTMPEPDDADAWVALAKEHNPGISADRLSVRAAEHAISAARAGHLPTLSASFSYGRTGAWYTRSASDPSYGPREASLGLTLSVPLYSGGQTQAEVRQALAQRDGASSALEVTQRQAEYDVRTYYKALQQGVAQVEAAQQAMDAAQRSVKSMQIGYEIGTQSLTNLVVAIGTLADTQSQYSSVRHQFVLNLLGLKRAAGVLSTNDLEEINRWLH